MEIILHHIKIRVTEGVSLLAFDFIEGGGVLLASPVTGDALQQCYPSV
tara:strand:+ start:337 stop:480 length:144 start_codon:yes stop_codon:yes gene_type:complete